MTALKNVDWASSMDLISVSMKKPFVSDVPIAQAIVPSAVTTIVLPITRLDAAAMQPSAIDDLAERMSNMVIRKIDMQTSGYGRGGGAQTQA